MADNYLENKMEALQARKAKEQRAREIAWKKRLDAYRKKMQAANEAAVVGVDVSTQQEGSDGQK